MSRCPICQARLQSVQCHRCGSDLTVFFQIERQAKQWLYLAGYYLIEKGNKPKALEYINKAMVLSKGSISISLIRTLYRFMKQESSAVHSYERALKKAYSDQYC